MKSLSYAVYFYKIIVKQDYQLGLHAEKNAYLIKTVLTTGFDENLFIKVSTFSVVRNA